MVEISKLGPSNGGLEIAIICENFGMLKNYVHNKINFMFNFSCENRKINVVNFCIENGYKDWDWGLKSSVSLNNVELIEYFISKHANVNGEETPILNECLLNNNFEAFLVLLYRGANRLEVIIFFNLFFFF